MQDDLAAKRAALAQIVQIQDPKDVQQQENVVRMALDVKNAEEAVAYKALEIEKIDADEVAKQDGINRAFAKAKAEEEKARAPVIEGRIRDSNYGTLQSDLAAYGSTDEAVFKYVVKAMDEAKFSRKKQVGLLLGVGFNWQPMNAIYNTKEWGITSVHLSMPNSASLPFEIAQQAAGLRNLWNGVNAASKPLSKIGKISSYVGLINAINEFYAEMVGRYVRAEDGGAAYDSSLVGYSKRTILTALGIGTVEQRCNPVLKADGSGFEAARIANSHYVLPVKVAIDVLNLPSKIPWAGKYLGDTTRVNIWSVKHGRKFGEDIRRFNAMSLDEKNEWVWYTSVRGPEGYFVNRSAEYVPAGTVGAIPAEQFIFGYRIDWKELVDTGGERGVSQWFANWLFYAEPQADGTYRMKGGEGKELHEQKL